MNSTTNVAGDSPQKSGHRSWDMSRVLPCSDQRYEFGSHKNRSLAESPGQAASASFPASHLSIGDMPISYSTCSPLTFHRGLRLQLCGQRAQIPNPAQQRVAGRLRQNVMCAVQTISQNRPRSTSWRRNASVAAEKHHRRVGVQSFLSCEQGWKDRKAYLRSKDPCE